MSLIFQIIDWRTFYDFKTKTTVIQIFGKTEKGSSVLIEVDDYESCFYTLASIDQIKKAIDKINSSKKKGKEDINEDDLSIQKNIKSKRFYGFHGNETELFTKISSKSNIVLRKLSNKLLEMGEEVFESNKDVIVQFIHDHKIKSCGWISIDKKCLRKNKKHTNNKGITEYDYGYHDSYCRFHFLTSHVNIKPAPEEYELKMAPFVICAYDIETISSDDGFPQARREEDKIVSIASTFSIVNEECYRRVILIVSDQDFTFDDDKNEVIICADEEDLIKTWAELIRIEDPDVMTEWNGFGFDDNYIHERVMRLCGIVNYSEDIEISNVKKDYLETMQETETEKDTTVTNLSRDEIKEMNKLFPINLSRFDEPTEFVCKKLASAALGDSTMRYYDMKGRCVFDLMKVVRRDYKLISYKLDYVASYMFRDKIKKYEHNDGKTIINVDTKDLHNGQYVIILRNDGASDYECFDEKKFQITIIDKDTLSINEELDFNEFSMKGNYFICNVKDDVKPKEIFEKYRSGNIKDLKELSLYNIQDCELCNKLCNKMFVMVNNIGMANVCYVPLNWIFNRGQSPKVYSLVSKKCLEEGYKIRAIMKKEEEREDEDFTYEGALVVEPVPGIYPAIFCLDYHALYPSSMICRNISHETFLMGSDKEIKELMKKYENEYTFNEVKYLPLDKKIVEQREEQKKYKKLNAMNMDDLDIVISDDMIAKEKDKEKSCYFAVNKNGKIGLLPEILTELLDNREAVKKQMGKETDPFKKKLLNGLQLAYKVTCNSVYGQLGCNEQIGPIALKDIAACTTATGREMLGLAKHFATKLLPVFVEYAITSKVKFYEYCNEILINLKNKPEEEKNEIFEKYRTKIRELFLERDENGKLRRKYITNFTIAYGDTDSIFVNMNLRYNNENQDWVDGEELRTVYMNAGIIASDIVSGLLPHPEELEYEKVLSPFISMAKKRYVGNFYTFNPKKPDMQYNMGFVLKRRDNARIVKYVIGGVVDKLLNSGNLELAKKECIDYIKKCLDDILYGKFNIKMFVFSKSLKREYKNRDGIVHAVLADRIGIRDPGNKPAPNDRIDFAFFVNPTANLQGDRAETPEFIIENKLKIDYAFYIEHQLLKPCCQIIELFNNKIKDVFKDYIDKSYLIVEGRKLISFDDINNEECDNDENEMITNMMLSFNKKNKKTTRRKK